jgi:predicted alpha-1,2-mannosidase
MSNKASFQMIRFLPVVFMAFTTANAQNDYTPFVNPMIGTGGHGHTFPGAAMPFAMVQLSPDTRNDRSWDGCSGYQYSDSLIYGFSHTHLSGTGCSDYGDIAFMPCFLENVEPEINYLMGTTSRPIPDPPAHAANFSHGSETAKAGYYSVSIQDEKINVELTSTTRTGLQKYTFRRAGFVWITLDLKHRDELLEGRIKEVDRKSFSGLRRSKAWATDQLLYYHFELSREWQRMKLFPDKNAGHGKLMLGFWVGAGESIMIKTSLSSVDEVGAKNNMDQELPHWDFEKVKKDADVAWNKELNRIKVYGGTNDEKVNFYTAMYHCMIHPNVMNDVDGRYRGRDRQVHKAEGFDYYTVFSLWDTHRALHPLLNMIDKKRSHDFIMTFKAQYEQSGRLPMWELWGNETNCMIGFHSVSVILDAYVKGVITKEELSAIYPAILVEASGNRFGLAKFRAKGYLEVEDESESVSKTLEYSYDMWCVKEIARYLDEKADENNFGKLAEGWRNMVDPSTGFVRPRKNGGWLWPFDPFQVNNHFTEANAWHYSFFPERISEKLLDSMFVASSLTTGREQSDITGLIGQYAHGNEPCHAFIYKLPDAKSRLNLKRVMSEFYYNKPDGLCGNEDCGQMSAWYVFSAMGFYPAVPGHPLYKRGVSLFDSVVFEGKNKVSAQITDNISFRQNSGRYTTPHYSAPVITSNKSVFSDTVFISISANIIKRPDVLVYYSINDGPFTKYGKPFLIHDNSKVIARIELMGKKGLVGHDAYTTDLSTAFFYKRPNNYSITLNSTYNKQYTADGDEGLIDGLLGDADWRKGRWQGYQGQNLECVIDLQKEMPVKTIQAGFLQDTRAWILFPRSVMFYGSADGINFEEIGSVGNQVADTSMVSQRAWLGKDNIQKSYRYLKIRAINYGKLPSWHPGAGGDAFIFIDEIKVE